MKKILLAASLTLIPYLASGTPPTVTPTPGPDMISRENTQQINEKLLQAIAAGVNPAGLPTPVNTSTPVPTNTPNATPGSQSAQANWVVNPPTPNTTVLVKAMQDALASMPGSNAATPSYSIGNVNSQGSATIYNSFLPTPTGTLPVGFSPTPYGILTNRAVTNFNVIIASTPIPVTIYTNGNDYAGLVVNTSSSLGSVTIFNSNGVTFNLLDRSSNNPVTLQNPITNPSSTYWGDVADSVYVVFSGTQGTTLTCGFTYDVLPVYAKAMYELQKFQLYGTNTPTFTFTPTGSPWNTYTPTSTPTPSLQYFNAAIAVSAPVTIATPSTNFKTNLNCLLQNFGTGYGSVTLSCGFTNIYYFSPGDSIPITVNSMIFGNGVTFFPTSTNAAVSCNITGFTSLSSQ